VALADPPHWSEDPCTGCHEPDLQDPLGGLFGIALPHVAALSISTGAHVHNLDHLGLPLVLVVVSVAGVGVGSLVTELHRIPRHPPAPAPSPP
jgi:hypothetical protein